MRIQSTTSGIQELVKHQTGNNAQGSIERKCRKNESRNVTLKGEKRLMIIINEKRQMEGKEIIYMICLISIVQLA
jgi:hypothetical protein